MANMKKLLLLLAIICFLGIGCALSEGPVTENKILKTTQAIYMDVRTVVTDPEVITLFTAEELERMVELEKRYLQVADTLRAFPDDAEAIEQISWIATEILTIIGDVESIEKYRPYVAAIRISIQVLRNHL
jgi:predicted RNA-binding protein with EMAP domain